MTEPFHRSLLGGQPGELISLDAPDPLPNPELNVLVHRAMEAAHQIDHGILHSERCREWNPGIAKQRVKQARRDTIQAWNDARVEEMLRVKV